MILNVIIYNSLYLCRHANNLIRKAKQFYNEPDSGGLQSANAVLNLSIDQTPQRRFSQCSAASSVSSNGSNNELSSLPINLSSYPDHSRSIIDSSILEDSTDNAALSGDNLSELSKRFNLSITSSVSTNTLRPSLAGRSPQSSPKHRPNLTKPADAKSHSKSHRGQSNPPNGQLSKANSSSVASLLSPIRSSSNKLNQSLSQQQTPLIKKSIKPVQTNSEARPRTYSTSRIPQLNHPAKQLVTSTVKKSTNAKSKQSTTSQQLPGANTTRIPASPRRRSLATSASSTNLINSSTNSSLNGSVRQSLIRNQAKSNLNSSLNAGRRVSGLTSNKTLSQSSSSIYNQLNSYNRREKLQTNESPKRTIVPKASSVGKAKVPLSRTQSTSSGLATKHTDSPNGGQTPKQEPQKPNGRSAEVANGPNTSLHNASISANTSICANTSITTHHQWYLHAYTERQAKLKHLSSADPIVYRDNIKSMKGMNEWYCRDNVANFITACRNLFKIQDCLLFETDDLVMRKNERSFILCMLEIARIGSVFGLAAPLIIQLGRFS